MKIWGVRDDSSSVLVVFLEEEGGPNKQEFLEAFRKIVEGEERPLEELGECADVREICSVGLFGLAAYLSLWTDQTIPKVMKIPLPEDRSTLDRQQLLRDVLSATAVKGL